MDWRENSVNRPLAEESRKFIGTSGLHELRVPSGYNKIEVFADTETYFDLNNGLIKPWE